MESLVLKTQTKEQITDYMAANHLVHYERGIFEEIISAINAGDMEQLDLFNSFGDQLRVITMNLHAYRKASNSDLPKLLSISTAGSSGRNGWIRKN
jgi:hypothetical protein